MSTKKAIFSIVAGLMLVAQPAMASTLSASESDDDENQTAAFTLTEAKAKNTGGTTAKEAGDSIELEFSQPTSKPAITAANIASALTVNNSHSFLDGAGALGGAVWSVDGEELTITLSAGTSLATVDVGDTVTLTGSTFTDLAGNAASGSRIITGSFGDKEDDEDGDEDEDKDDDEGDEHRVCVNTIINRRLYQIGTDKTIYKAKHCMLKAFRGEAVFRVRGEKFQDIIHLDTLPPNVTISTRPVLPAEGTLVKGNGFTVWFIDHDGHRRGFVSAIVFLNLGFKFDQVQTISQTDLDLVTPGPDVATDQSHPDGSLIKCLTSPVVFAVISNMRFPFANAEAFKKRGHIFSYILVVDCSKFAYAQGAPVTD